MSKFSFNQFLVFDVKLLQEATQKTYQTEKENPTSWLDLFRTPKMRLRFLMITITWFVRIIKGLECAYKQIEFIVLLVFPPFFITVCVGC